jgi:transcriptional regulator with XRE-family HTH domain
VASVAASSLLQRARSLAGISQRELARRARTSQARISRIEGGREEPSFAQLEKLVAACGLRLRASVERPDEDLERTLRDLAVAAELSRFSTGLAIAAERSP